MTARSWCSGCAVAKPSRPNLTRAQVRTLENLAAGRDSWFGLHGQSEFGGHHQTMQSLKRKLFVSATHQITPTGRAALKAFEGK